MPLLGGIFGKKNRSSARSVNGLSSGASLAPSDLDSTLPSPTTSYVTTDKSLPSSPNGKSSLSPETARISPNTVYPSFAGGNPSASSSKLRLPFGRKKSKPPVPEGEISNANYSIPPPPLPSTARLSTSAASDSDTFDTRHLRPPPSKSAIFAAYGDPNSALSTRSLPDESMRSWPSMHAHSAPPTPQVPLKEKEKRPSLFFWSKSSSSGPSKPPLSEQSRSPLSTNLDSPPRLDVDSSSFNLKSFRHVRPPSPTASTSSLVAPPARPRGASINSDSSQRISVAAFREAQARRSTAGSPVPSFRSPSPSLPPPGFPPDGQRGRASPRPSSAAQPHSSPHVRNSAYNNQRRRSANIAVGYTSESEDSTTSSEEESDDEGAGEGKNGNIQRDGTITPRTRPLIGRRQAKSELGHGSSPYDSSSTTNPNKSPNYLTTRSQNGHGQVDIAVRQSNFVANKPNSPVESPPPRSNSSLGNFGDNSRTRASKSTSALSPTPAAKRASILVQANAGLNQDPLAVVKQTTRHVRDSSTYSNPAPQTNAHIPDTDSSESDSDSDSDNAPLASLVPPRRPGSALSSVSNTSQRTNGTRGPGGRAMSKPLIDINALTAKKPSVGPYKDNDDGFTKGGLLAGHLSSQASDVLVESPTSIGFTSSPLSNSVFNPAGITSKSPPGFAHFATPASPPEEIQAFTNLAMRLPTQPAPLVQEPEVEKEEEEENGPEKRRDVLTERLAKLAKGKETESGERVLGLGSNLSGKKTSASPPPQAKSPLQSSTSPRVQAVHLSTPPVVVSSRSSLPDDEVIQDLDDGILALISRMGDSDGDVRTSFPSLATAGADQDDGEDTSDSESDTYGEPEKKGVTGTGKTRVANSDVPRAQSPEKGRGSIAPIPIKQRVPQPSFSVMSRPPIQKPMEDDARSNFTTASLSTNTNADYSTRFSVSSPRSSTATDITKLMSNSTLNSMTPSAPVSSSSASAARQRSSTVVPSSSNPSVATTTSSSSSTFGASTPPFAKTNPSRSGDSSAASSSNASSTSAGTGTSPRWSFAKNEKMNVLRSVASGGDFASAKSSTAPVSPGQNARQRSSSMFPMMSTSTPSPNKSGISAPAPSKPPTKPFAVRRDSPASSTGDSSSGRAPLTPRDGSDVGSSKTSPSSKREEWGSGVSGLGVSSNKGGIHSGTGGGRRVERRSVSFDDEVDREVKGKKSRDRMDGDDAETRRRERRRSEAKAAIELGNVINGPGPVVSDDEDELPINQAMNARMSTLNPMMAMPPPMQMQMSYSSVPGSPANWGGNLSAWPQPGPPQMLSAAQFMVPPPVDPKLVLAHQQAMMFAKQAYQMAVAQHAMAAAADEWDRNSVMGGSVYGGPSSNASVMMGPSPYNNMMGYGGMNNGWPNSPVMFPNAPQSVYGGRGGSARSEFGAAASSIGAGHWSSARSSYGESFGPSERLKHSSGNRGSGARDPGYYPPMPPIPQSHSSSSSSAKARGRTTSGPAIATRGVMKKAPPSSWKG